MLCFTGQTLRGKSLGLQGFILDKAAYKMKQVTALGKHITVQTLSKKSFYTKISVLIFLTMFQHDRKQGQIKQNACALGLGPISHL